MSPMYPLNLLGHDFVEPRGEAALFCEAGARVCPPQLTAQLSPLFSLPDFSILLTLLDLDLLLHH